MTPEIRRVANFILIMFLSLFVAASAMQVVNADGLNNDSRNQRAVYDGYKTQRGAILVNNKPIAESIKTSNAYKYLRQYTGEQYSAITGYYSLFQGRTGLENVLDSSLRGDNSAAFFEQLNALLSGNPVSGASVELTIDEDVQLAAWKALGKMKGAVVAIEPATGRILALVSKSGFDANLLSTHNTSDASANYTALLTNKNAPLINRAIGGDLYAPGSVFKLIVAAAAFESGKYDPDAIARQAEAFGFGEAFAIPLKSTPSTYPENMDDAQTGLTAFGQFDVRVSPLQMAMVSAAIANAGIEMKPYLVEQIFTSNLTVLEEGKPTEFGRSITTSTAERLKTMMIAAVSSGVSSNARIPGIKVAGKTGTAENGVGDPYTLWFTGFAPADNPQVAVAVVIEDGGGMGQSGRGNTLAAPIAKKVMEAVLSK